ncbi:MAG: alpha-amylase family glycosyl hydrolase [Vulcanimicrobiota bacterium]
MRIIFIFLAVITLFFLAKNIFIRDNAYSAPASVKHAPWSDGAVIYELNTRQFTPEGTFKAIIPRLKELKEMGVDIVWLMPVHPIGEKKRKGTLGSPYAVKDYYAVNPEFGTAGDFKALVKAVHDEGMHIIIDMVANHTAWDNPLIEKHPDWYRKDSNGNIVPPVPDWEDVAHLDYGKPELRRYMTDMLKFWVKDMNVDGFRCDVASMVPVSFWNEARKEVDAIRPTFWLAEAEEPELLKEAFDCDYDSELYLLFNRIAAQKAHAQEIQALLKSDSDKYPQGSWRMLFTSNHDQNTWHKPAITRLGAVGAETFAFLTFTLPGMPLIYNGQEAGSTQQLAFFEKDPITWNKSEFLLLYAELCALRKSHPALWKGSFRIITVEGEPDVFACLRKDNKTGEELLVLANLSPGGRSVNVPVGRKLSTPPECLYRQREMTMKDGAPCFHLTGWDYGLYRLK